jgi:signal transduction histidine kinase
MRIEFPSSDNELTSSRWLATLARTSTPLKGDARGSIQLDLTATTWLGHLPLLALCLGIQALAHAKFNERRVIMPKSVAVRAFLERWGFYQFAARYGFLIEADPVEKSYSEALTRSTVLRIHEFKAATEARDLRDMFRRADTHLRNLLITAAFLDEQDIRGLADLIVYELCDNAVEHAETSHAAMIFGHVSRDNDPTRSVYERGAADWEKPFFRSIRGEGMTEIVIGDSGIGIIGSLREVAARQGITEPADILRWAFEPFSTRRREVAMHTRGLWAVKSKVRDLRGILYVRSGVRATTDGVSGGWSASWDFFNAPSVDAPQLVRDEVPFGGTQVQIILPHRMSRYTFIEYHRPLLSARARELEPREMLIPIETSPIDLSKQIAATPDHGVLFVDMSQMNSEKWSRHDVDGIGKQIYEGLQRHNCRLWLLNPSDKTVQDLQASNWILRPWRTHGILLPFVRIGDPDKPPHINFIMKDPAHRSADQGDTAVARLRLLELIGLLAGTGEKITADRFNDLDADERSWIMNALVANRSLVDPTRDEHGAFTAAMDIDKLGRRAVSSLLGQIIGAEVDRRLVAQRDGTTKVWYRLPSQVYCRQYIDPRLFSELNPVTRDAIERWIEERIAATRAEYAISYASFAPEMLTRARRAGTIRTLPSLRHYSGGRVRDQLKEIMPDSRVVLIAAISGSGKTIVDTIEILQERDISTSVVCIIDTTTAAERAPVLADLEKRGQFHYRIRREIEKYRVLPHDERHVPIAIVDPETLVPVIQVPELPTRLSDGRFWRLLSESEGVSVGAVTYKGIDYTTMILLRNALKSDDLAELLIQDFRECFNNEPERPLAPDVICCPIETLKVLSVESIRRLKERLRHEFPNTRFITEVSLERSANNKREGMFVVIFSAAATSGAGVARIQRYFQGARRIHLSIFISRISDGVLLALTGDGRRVSLTAFQRLVSGSPELRLGSSRSIALPALRDYRASCLSNRLLLFVDKLSRDLSEPRTAQSPDELDDVARPEPKATLHFDDKAVYKFGTAVGLESLQNLVRQCYKQDQKWLYGILDEVASRAEASLRSSERDSREWQRVYVEDLARVYREAPYRQAPGGPDDVSARRTILEALLLHRWRWAEARERVDPEHEPFEKWQAPRDPVSTAFARLMLGDMWSANDPDFRAAVIRSISKVDRELLIEELDEIIQVARRHRTTELTLALELAKMLDDFDSSERLMQRLTEIVRGQAHKRPAGRDEPFDVAVDDLLADIGLGIFEKDGEDRVGYLPWREVAAILRAEPPDHDRTIRLLIRSMHGRFGHNARFLYYREETPGHYVYADAWPRRSVTDKRPIREANIQAISLLGTSDYYFSAQLGSDAQTEKYLKTLSQIDERKLRKWGMALFRLHLPDRVGLLRVWQNVERFGALRRADVEEMRAAVRDAEKLIARQSSAVRVIGDWQYEQMIGSLATGAPATSAPSRAAYDPVIHFADVVRELLGGDVCSLLTLDLSETEWTRVYLGGRGRSLPLKFPANDRRRLTNHVAMERRGRIFHDIADAEAHEFFQRPAVEWAEAWFALPLVHPRSERCRAVAHIWHHIPGWFDEAEPLMGALQSLGGTVVELNAAYKMGQMVRQAWFSGTAIELNGAYESSPVTSDEALMESGAFSGAKRMRQMLVFDRDIIHRVGSQLVNLTLASDGLLEALGRSEKNSATLDALQSSIAQIQVHLRRLLQNLQVPESEPVPASLERLVKNVVEQANRKYGEELFRLKIHDRIPPLELRERLLQRAIEELLRNAKAHSQPGEPVLLELTCDDVAVVLDVRNAGYGVPATAKKQVFGMGSGLLVAKTAAERHGGRLEEVGEPGEAAVFRMTLPLPAP